MKSKIRICSLATNTIKFIGMIKTLSVIFIFVLGVASIIGSSSGGGGGGNGDGGSDCERVTALAEGCGDIEIHNDLDTGLEAFFPELAFGALIRPNVCEIYGVPSGSRDLELEQCNFTSDEECDIFGPKQELIIEVEEGGKKIIIASDYF